MKKGEYMVGDVSSARLPHKTNGATLHNDEHQHE